MSSFPLFSSAVVGRPVAQTQLAASLRKTPAGTWLAKSGLSAMPKLAEVMPASRLEARPIPEMVSCGIREIDALTGGLPRGCLTEVCGAASSGRTSVLLAALAAATERQEACALVDATDAFDPYSAAAAGVNFERLLWVRCGVRNQKSNSPQSHPSTTLRAGSVTEKRIRESQPIASQVEQALRVTDLLLQSGGFGLVMIDLGDVPFKTARRIPLTSWFRFQRAVEHTPTVLFVITRAPCTQTCASLLVKVRKQSAVVGRSSLAKKPSAFSSQLSADVTNALDSAVEGHAFSHAESVPKYFRALAPEVPAHTKLLDELHIEGELLRSRLERKPVRSVTAAFTTKAVRAG